MFELHAILRIPPDRVCSERMDGRMQCGPTISPKASSMRQQQQQISEQISSFECTQITYGTAYKIKAKDKQYGKRKIKHVT